MGTRGRLGELIRSFRRRAGLTQQEVADLAGLSVAGLRDVEQGRVTRPRASTVRRLADVLGLTLEELDTLLRRSNSAAEDEDLRFEILGPLRVVVDGAVVDPGSEKQRILTGLLALSPNTPVGRDSLVEALWGDSAGAGAVDSLQSRISRLRRRLRLADTEGDGVLVATRGGYQLSVAESQHDLLAFQRLVERARSARDAGELAEAAKFYASAMALWRGAPLEGLGALQSHPVVVGLARECPMVAVEYADVAYQLGHYQELLPLLQRIAEVEPLHETVHAALMIALAGSGQQAAALNVFDTLRKRLANELGADPGHELVSAYQRVLRQEVAQPEFSPVTAHRQLPPDIADFSGRAAELKQLRETLPQAGGGTAVAISLIEGMAGVGKTRLAVRLAHQLLAEGRYTEQQLYVDLRGHSDQPPADPSAVLASFLRLLGVPGDQIPPNMEERSILYRDRLYGKQALVLLDNAAGEDQVLPLLPAGPTNLVLITSRRALALDGARSLPLDVFRPDEATQLLERVVGRGRVHAERAAAERVVELCGRLPLAVALAGRRLQSRPVWGFNELLSRLGQSCDRVGELAVGTRRLQAVFDLSYDALDQAERRTFHLLGLHPGDTFTVDAAVALTGLTPLRARRLLDRLADEHLVDIVNGDTYRLHDLLAAYARNVAEREESEESRRAAIGRLLDFYLHTAAQAAQRLQANPVELDLAGSAPAYLPRLASKEEAKHWLDSERPNLIDAVTLAAEHGWPGHAWQLTRSLREYLHLYGYGHDQDWVRVHEAALAAAVAAGDEVGEALTRTDLAAAYLNHGRGEDARRHLLHALRFHREVGDRKLECSTLNSLGRLCYRFGDFREAARYLQQAASLCLGRDSYLEQTTRAYLGMVSLVFGDTDEALEHYAHSLRLARRLGNTDGETHMLAEIGWVEWRLGRRADATAHFDKALAVATSNGLSPREAHVRHRLADVLRSQGCLVEALDNLTEALRIVRAVGGDTSESDVLIDLGATYREIGNMPTAYTLLDEAIRSAIKRKERYQEARGLNELAELHRCTSRAELARDNWRRAHALFAELGTPQARELQALTCDVGSVA